MKLLLSLIGAVVLGGCATPPGLQPPRDNRSAAASNLHAVGVRNPTGLPVGEYRIIDARGSTAAQGRFQNGKMDGRWDFFDSRQVKVAEITYQNGARTGPYKTYFSSFLIPAAAGKLESEGRLQNGQAAGRHLAYSADGHVFSDATFEAGKLRHADVGAADAATKTVDADSRFFEILEGAVRSAVR